MVYSVRLTVEGFGYDAKGEQVALPAGERFFVTYEHTDSSKPLLYGYADTASAKSLWISKDLVSAEESDSSASSGGSDSDEGLRVAEVLHGYKGHGLLSGCLSIRKGEVLYILEEDYSEDWYFAVNVRGEEGVVPKSYVKILETQEKVDVTEATQTDTAKPIANPARTKPPKAKPERRVSGSEDRCVVKSLVEQCSAVLLQEAQGGGDLLNEAVFQNINKHCSKRFSRVVLLSVSSKAFHIKLRKRDREIEELKKKVKEMDKVIVGYENAEWVLKELAKTTKT